MTNEVTSVTYTDAEIEAFIEARPVQDMRGINPVKLDYSTNPPTQGINPNWIPTYDINAAAADIWEEKAAAIVCNFDFAADGASYSRDQVYQHYMHCAQKFRSKSRPGSVKFHSTQRERTQDGYVVETQPIIDQYQVEDIIN